VFDWWLDGMGKRNGTGQFIHDAARDRDDGVGDCIFDAQCRSGGAAYAPYLHDLRLKDDLVTLYYTLSTWNPYQTMLMGHQVRLPEIYSLEND
jgi:hypothetical protein